MCLEPRSAFTHANCVDILTSTWLVASQMSLLPDMMIMDTMLTIKMIFVASMWTASMAICSNAYM